MQEFFLSREPGENGVRILQCKQPVTFPKGRRGEPIMFCVHCGKNLGDGAVFCQFCGAPVAPVPYMAAKKRFARYSTDKKIAGVCGGVARYFDLDASLVRALWLLCVLLGGTGLLAYIILWIVMPLDPAPALPA